jgi:Flp pilus assembly protein TadG
MSSSELVLLTPVLFTVLFLIVQFGLWYHSAQVATTAAREGLRATRSFRGSTAAGEQRANDFLTRLGRGSLAGATVSATRDVATGEATVTIDGRAPNVIPFLTLKVHEVARGPIEPTIVVPP